MVPVVVGHHHQSELALVEVLTSDQPQVDQREVRDVVHGDQNVAADFLDGLKKEREVIINQSSISLLVDLLPSRQPLDSVHVRGVDDLSIVG